jgi:cell division protein FtsQ
MSKAFVLVPISPRSERRPGRQKMRLEGILRRVLWISIIVLLVCLLGGILFQLFVSPNMLVRKIEINGDLPFSREEIMALAGLSRNEYFFALDARVLEARLKTHPLVKEALVEKVFPETLKVTLVKRRPLALAYAVAGGKTVPLACDEDGVFFERGPVLSKRDLPVLSGIKLPGGETGATLSKILLPFLGDLSEIKKSSVPLYNLISEIHVVGVSSGSYELILYPLPYPVRVWIGKRLNAGMLRYMFFALYFMQKEGILREIEEVDFRSGEAVYRRKGEQ